MFATKIFVSSLTLCLVVTLATCATSQSKYDCGEIKDGGKINCDDCKSAVYEFKETGGRLSYDLAGENQSSGSCKVILSQVLTQQNSAPSVDRVALLADIQAGLNQCGNQITSFTIEGTEVKLDYIN